jgi:hypothetical protein
VTVIEDLLAELRIRLRLVARRGCRRLARLGSRRRLCFAAQLCAQVLFELVDRLCCALVIHEVELIEDFERLRSIQIPLELLEAR